MIATETLLARAEYLAQQDTEIEWRDCIKHSYYYLYHLVKAYIEENYADGNVQRENMGEHQYLIEQLRSMDSKLAKTLAREMQMLKDKRVLCCYFLNDDVSKMQAHQQVVAAKKASDRLSNL